MRAQPQQSQASTGHPRSAVRQAARRRMTAACSAQPLPYQGCYTPYSQLETPASGFRLKQREGGLIPPYDETSLRRPKWRCEIATDITPRAASEIHSMC